MLFRCILWKRNGYLANLDVGWRGISGIKATGGPGCAYRNIRGQYFHQWIHSPGKAKDSRICTVKLETSQCRTEANLVPSPSGNRATVPTPPQRLTPTHTRALDKRLVQPPDRCADATRVYTMTSHQTRTFAAAMLRHSYDVENLLDGARCTPATSYSRSTNHRTTDFALATADNNLNVLRSNVSPVSCMRILASFLGLASPTHTKEHLEGSATPPEPETARHTAGEPEQGDRQS
ncbi:hypothetical protein CBL_03103 [Carabus blaptoides fortunei]